MVLYTWPDFRDSTEFYLNRNTTDPLQSYHGAALLWNGFTEKSYKKYAVEKIYDSWVFIGVEFNIHKLFWITLTANTSTLEIQHGLLFLLSDQSSLFIRDSSVL